MKVESTGLPGVLVIEPVVHRDHRGFFLETWRAERYAEAGLPTRFVQDNHSRSARGTLRGLHYQVQQPQGKLVRVVAGEVYDVAVDLRRSSPTFGKWVAERLSAENRRMLWVPAGFAHGFLVVSESAEFLYKTTDFYAPAHERSQRGRRKCAGRGRASRCGISIRYLRNSTSAVAYRHASRRS